MCRDGARSGPGNLKSKHRLRIRTQHLQRHSLLADLLQHRLDQRIAVMADEVDEEHVGPLATARRTGLDARQVDAVLMERYQQLDRKSVV